MEDERVATHDRLPTREQVDVIGDLGSLIALQDEVTEAAKNIEVDLEFRSDDGADDAWEQRARRALAAHYVCNGHLTRRINFLRRGGKPITQEVPSAKAARREAAAKLLAAQTEARRSKKDFEREKTAQAMIAFADRQNLLAAFHRVARKNLDGETFKRLSVAAREELEQSLSAMLDVQAIEARRAETQGGSVHESAVAASAAPESPTP